MIKLKVHVTSEKRSFTSKAGNPVTLTECFVFIPNSPYPVKIAMFGLDLKSAIYSVPFGVEVFGGRLVLQPDFNSAEYLGDK